LASLAPAERSMSDLLDRYPLTAGTYHELLDGSGTPPVGAGSCGSGLARDDRVSAKTCIG
ncbi:hypothetical protein ACQZEU_12560, partial [Corynebacterium diphtheriae]